MLLLRYRAEPFSARSSSQPVMGFAYPCLMRIMHAMPLTDS